MIVVPDKHCKVMATYIVKHRNLNPLSVILHGNLSKRDHTTTLPYVSVPYEQKLFIVQGYLPELP